MFIDKLSDADIVTLYSVVPKLKQKNYSDEFIRKVMSYAQEDEGAYNLIILWNTLEEDDSEKEEIIADLEELIDEDNRNHYDGVYIRFDDLEGIAQDIEGFKNSLLMIVNQKVGSISSLAEKTGIPQPSLSRFFNSVSMPRKTTLLKIAKALNLSQVEIATEWVDD